MPEAQRYMEQLEQHGVVEFVDPSAGLIVAGAVTVATAEPPIRRHPTNERGSRNPGNPQVDVRFINFSADGSNENVRAMSILSGAHRSHALMEAFHAGVPAASYSSMGRHRD